MARVLITGMSGAGKSSLLDLLARRGHRTVDTDHGDWTVDERRWDEQRMTELLDAHEHLVVSGTVENQGAFSDRFDHVVLLSAPVDVLLARVSTRTTNPYGRTPEQQADIRRYVIEVEPLLRRGATLELDGRRPLEELADVVEGLLATGAGKVASAPGERGRRPTGQTGDMEPGIFLIGGGWSAEHRDAVWGPFLRRASERADGGTPSIACVVLDEGDGPDQVQRWAGVLGQTAVCTPVPVLVPEGAHPTDEQRAALSAAHGVLVCGGLTPAYAAALAPTAELIRGLVADGVAYAGFSAGSAVAAGRAVVGGWRDHGVPVCPEDAGEDLDEITVVDGLGLVPFALDVHAAQWGTLPRLVAAVAGGLVDRGVALDEDTVLQVVADGSATVAGAGRVHLVRRPGHGAEGVRVTSFPAGAAVPTGPA